MIQKVKFIDLFAGLGGIRTGFEKAFNKMGFQTECVLTSEIKDSAIAALKNNFEHKQLLGDIREINEKEIEDFDYLLAGFPCQAFSTAGKGLGFLDTRGTLFFEIERILKEKKPKGFILENVDGLVKHNLENKNDEIGKTLKTILSSLENIGYKVNWKVLDSKDFGLAQTRKRIYIVGTLDETINLDDFSNSQAVFKDIMEKGKETIHSHFTTNLLSHFKPSELYGKSIKDKRGGKNNIHSWDIEIKGKISDDEKKLLSSLLLERRKRCWAEEIGIDWMDGMPLTVKQVETFFPHNDLKIMLDNLVKLKYLAFEHPKKIVEETTEDGKIKRTRMPDKIKEKGYNIVAGKLSFEFSKILDIDDVTPTLVAMDVSKNGVIDGDGIRTLTIREGLRLFGYPENYSLEMFNLPKQKSKAFDLLGNTVAVPVIEQIATKLAKYNKNKIDNN